MSTKDQVRIDDAASASNISSECIRWMRKSTADPFSKLQSDDFYPYDDIENMIIEDAFRTGESHVMLDDYHIDFKHNVQISNKETSERRPVKRMVCAIGDKHRREERFLPNPVAPDRPFSGQYGFVSPFIIQVVKELGLTKAQLPSKNETIVPMITEMAALGIIEEGKTIGKPIEAESVAKILMDNKELGMKTVWKCCAKLYTMNGFLFQTVNETLRMIGNKQHSKVWRSKTSTLGPYCLLLWDNPFDSKITKPDTILFRGVQLSDEMVNVFKDDCLKDPKPWHSFQAFTSCTRNLSVAEMYGNVLLMMTTQVAFTIDIQAFSMFPDEEEELLFPGVCFTIDRMEYNESDKKHLIYLTLKHKYNKSDKHEIMPRNQTDESPSSYFDFDSLLRRDFDYDDYDDTILHTYYQNRHRSAIDRISTHDILRGNGVDISRFAEENPDLILHQRLDRYGLREAWTEDER